MWLLAAFGGSIPVALLGSLFVILGYASLTWWLPARTNTSQPRADVYVARISNWFVATGLSLIVLWAVARIVVRSLLVLKQAGVIH